MELNSYTEQRKRGTFNNIIKGKLGDAITDMSISPPSTSIPYSGGDLDPPALDEVYEDLVQPKDVVVFEQLVTDHWTRTELNLP